MPTIDLNSDLGESYGPWLMGDDAAMLALVTSANIACGGHAGDPETMYATLCLAAKHGVVVGAHPGYIDREGFGRRIIPMQPAEIGHLVLAQIGALSALAVQAGTRVAYVKLHGALANLAAADATVAKAATEAIRALSPQPADPRHFGHRARAGGPRRRPAGVFRDLCRPWLSVHRPACAALASAGDADRSG